MTRLPRWNRAASRRLVKYIRVTEAALGDGVKKVYESEKASLKKLRRVNGED